MIMNDENISGSKAQNSGNRGYKIIIAILLLIIAFLLWELYHVKSKMDLVTNEKNTTETKKQVLKNSLDSLLTKYDSIKVSYGKLTDKLTAQDSIILANAEEIQKLIASQADYRRIKRKLDYLRGITQSYVTQLDSLFTVTKELKEENTKITDNLKQEKKKSLTLTKDKEKLTEKVNIASSLQAYKIIATPIRMKGGGEKEAATDKAKKTDRIKICFTLSRNLIIQGGSKDIYLRIARPDNEILVRGKGIEYSFVTKEGDTLQFSAKKNIMYDNKAMDVCMQFDKSSELKPGNYMASVYADGILIGETSFELK